MLERTWLRWFVATLIYLAATGFNMLLQPMLEGRAPLLPYFPALVFVGLACGIWPALALLIASALTVLDRWIDPVGQIWPIAKVSDFVLIALFIAAGIVVAAVSSWTGELMARDRMTRRRLSMALSAGRMVAWDWNLRSSSGSVAGDAQALFGAPWRKMEDMFASMHPEDVAEARRACAAAVQSGEPVTFVCRMAPGGGDTVWTQTDAVTIDDQRGRALRLSGITVDITATHLALRASQTAEEQLLEDARRKDAFLATLAHELRNPMASIRYALAVLQRPAVPEPKRERVQEIIARQSAHMARLLDDLLDISRITRDVIPLHLESIDLRSVIAGALDVSGPVLSERQQEVSVDAPAEPVWIRGDATRLQQVLGNLLDNAAKYSRNPGQVQVQLQAFNAHAVLTVTDTGIGIPEDQLLRVFEMFTRLDNTGTAPPGLGIGLALSRRLVELHGGSIRAGHNPAVRGTRFEIRLPLTEAPRAAAESSHSQATEMTARSVDPILVVDDNVDSADALAEALRLSGFSVRTAYTGQEALDRFAQQRPRAVLLDIGLPDMSGIDVAKQLRALPSPATSPALALIAISGWGQPSDRKATTAAGFDAHLVKPVDFAVVEQKLKDLPAA